MKKIFESLDKIISHFKPDLFIPGAAKSGTTSLHDLLNEHPEISMSSIKEPGYWKNKKFNNFCERDILNYENLFEKNQPELLIAIIIGCIGSHYIFKDEEGDQINK